MHTIPTVSYLCLTNKESLSFCFNSLVKYSFLSLQLFDLSFSSSPFCFEACTIKLKLIYNQSFCQSLKYRMLIFLMGNIILSTNNIETCIYIHINAYVYLDGFCM